MHSNIYNRLEQRLSKRWQQGILRQLPANKASSIDFSSNDYLGFNQEKVNTFSPVARGATGSRLLTGNSEAATKLEEKLAQLFKSESALLFNSGFSVNSGIFQAICGAEDCIILDTQAHASLKDGAKLSSASVFYFRHNDTAHLEQRLQKLSQRAQNSPYDDQTGILFVAVESVYSMDGDIAPLEELLHLCKRYQAHLIIDEAHAFGVLGEWGEGLVSAKGLEDKVFARILTFGKAIGYHGAVVLGKKILIQTLINFCNSFIYTTALPLDHLAAIDHNISHLFADRMALLQLRNNISYACKAFRLENKTHATPIFSLVFKDIVALKEASQALAQHNINVFPIFSPTVKRGTERLRVIIHAHNTPQEIDLLRKVLKPYEQFWQENFHYRH